MKKFLLFLFICLSLSAQLKSQGIYYPPALGLWDSILPQNLNYCQPRIDSLYNYLQAKNSKSFIILKDGKRVLEKYFGTYTKDSLFYWASASKSLAALITGIAQKEGYININNKVSQYIGTGWTSETLIKENLINVSDLLKMTTGTDDTPTLPCTHEDTAKVCLQYLADATTRWGYHTGAYRKIQDVVSTTVGQSYNVITTNWVKNKIGMSSGFWFEQVFYSRARDMARFGLLCLNKAIWANDTILKDSVYFKAMVNTSQNLNQAYGYLWWLNGKSTFMTPQTQLTFTGTLMPNAPSDMYCALGKNDQKIYVVPSQKLVVIRQGNTAGGFNLAASSFDNTLWDYINKLTCPVGINENYTSTPALIYPNPFTETFTLVNKNYSSIKIVDVVGNIIYSNSEIKNEQNIEINLDGISKGIYFIELSNIYQIKSVQRLVKN